MRTTPDRYLRAGYAAICEGEFGRCGASALRASTEGKRLVSMFPNSSCKGNFFLIFFYFSIYLIFFKKKKNQND